MVCYRESKRKEQSFYFFIGEQEGISYSQSFKWRKGPIHSLLFLLALSHVLFPTPREPERVWASYAVWRLLGSLDLPQVRSHLEMYRWKGPGNELWQGQFWAGTESEVMATDSSPIKLSFVEGCTQFTPKPIFLGFIFKKTSI